MGLAYLNRRMHGAGSDQLAHSKFRDGRGRLVLYCLGTDVEVREVNYGW